MKTRYRPTADHVWEGRIDNPSDPDAFRWHQVVQSGKVVSLDIAEVSPRFDEDNQTAKLAAITIYAVINTIL